MRKKNAIDHCFHSTINPCRFAISVLPESSMNTTCRRRNEKGVIRLSVRNRNELASPTPKCQCQYVLILFDLLFLDKFVPNSCFMCDTGEPYPAADKACCNKMVPSARVDFGTALLFLCRYMERRLHLCGTFEYARGKCTRLRRPKAIVSRWHLLSIVW